MYCLGCGYLIEAGPQGLADGEGALVSACARLLPALALGCWDSCIALGRGSTVSGLGIKTLGLHREWLWLLATFLI